MPSFINTIYIKYIDFFFFINKYEIAYIYNFLSKYKARLEKYTFVKKKKNRYKILYYSLHIRYPFLYFKMFI